MIEMTIENVRIQPETDRRFVILQDASQTPRLSIAVGNAEGYAIAMGLPGRLWSAPPPRPMTHDLLKNILDGLGAKPVRVEVTKVVDEIFYAQIILEMAGKQYIYDARPSDAFALAVRTQTPIFVDEDILEHAGTAISTSPSQ